MNTQPPNPKTRRVRFVAALLAAFALLAAACSGSETTTETTGADSPTTTPVVDVEPDSSTGDGVAGEEGSSGDAAVSADNADSDENRLVTSETDPDEPETFTTELEGDGHTHTDDEIGEHTHDEPLTQADVNREEAVGLTSGEKEAAIAEQEAGAIAERNPPAQSQVETNVGPDGVAYNPAFVKVTPKSGVIHNHRWVGQYFLGDYKPLCSPVLDNGGVGLQGDAELCASPESLFVEERIFVNTRSPRDEPSQADYTPRYSYGFGLSPHPERGYYQFQWIDDYVPIKANADLRIRNTKTGKTEHWRIHSVQPLIPGAGATEVWDREAHLLGFNCGIPNGEPVFCEQPPGLEVGDKYWKHLVYTCFYGRDGVEFPAGMGRASVSIAFEMPTVRGGDTPSGMGWMPYRNNHSGWYGQC